MITLSTPLLLETSMMVLRAGMSTSQPSRPNRFSDDHFLWRNSSNLWTGGGAAASHCGSDHDPPPPPRSQKNTSLQLHGMLIQLTEVLLRCAEEPTTDLVDRIILARRVLFSSRLNCMTPGVSNLCLIHWHCSTLLMNMNSTPICWQ